jgi:hypothetical protein
LLLKRAFVFFVVVEVVLTLHGVKALMADRSVVGSLHLVVAKTLAFIGVFHDWATCVLTSRFFILNKTEKGRQDLERGIDLRIDIAVRWVVTNHHQRLNS